MCSMIYDVVMKQTTSSHGVVFSFIYPCDYAGRILLLRCSYPTRTVRQTILWRTAAIHVISMKYQCFLIIF